MQFSSTLLRILQRIAYINPAHGPILLSKFDLADGSYRIPLSPEASLELAVVLPLLRDNQPLGWHPVGFTNGVEIEPAVLLLLHGISR